MKELKVIPPEGYEIDKENSTFECIKFKKKEPFRWRDFELLISGYYITTASDIIQWSGEGSNLPAHYNLFVTRAYAKSALAMARMSQIMANDTRFGGPITNEEWDKDVIRYVISRSQNGFILTLESTYHFLAFRTYEQAHLFLTENLDLIKDFYLLSHE